MIDADANLFLYLNTLFATPWLSWFFGQVTHLGNGWTQLMLVTPVIIIISRRKFVSHFPALVIAAIASGLLVSGMKIVVDRQRPPEYFAEKNIKIHTPDRLPVSRSFPSGHTQTAFVTAVYLCCLYPTLSIVFLLLAFLVGLSRIALGVHFPLDVFTGAIIGSGFAIIGFRLNLARLRHKEHKA